MPALPPGVTLADQWGRSALDVPSRLTFNFISLQLRRTQISGTISQQSGTPFTMTTGSDANGDGVFNDRPAGVGRNTLRADGQVTVNMQVAYQFAFGRTAPLPPGIGLFGGGGAAQVRTFDQGNARYRLQVYVQAQNLTNESNYLGYSGTLTSPFFGRPTSVRGMRKIDAGISMTF